MTRIGSYDPERLSALLPYPAVDADKRSRGTLVFVGGCDEFPGAAVLACTAAELMGAGYVEAYCGARTIPIVQMRRPSVVTREWGPEMRGRLCSHHGQPRACLIGSGTQPQSAPQMSMAADALSSCDLPVVVDGGALSAVASPEGLVICDRRAARSLPTVLTPHAGEAARLGAAADVPAPAHDASEEELADQAAALAAAYRATVLLKGPVSYIAPAPAPGGEAQVFAMRQGTSALAKAGTGDVLAGMVAALLAQGLAPADACVLGATLHAEAARAAQARLGAISVCAQDVAASIPEAIRIL